jgi:trans-aconitate methyltransferase
MEDIWRNGDKYKVLNRKVQFLNAIDLVQKIEILPFSKIIDIGCGTGDLLIYLAKMHKDASFYGIDLSGSMLNEAIKTAKKEKLKNIQFVNTDISSLQINEKFDVILSNAAFHWFKDKIDENIFKQLISSHGVIAIHTAGTDLSVNKMLDKEEQKFLSMIAKMDLSKYYKNYTPFATKRLTSQELSKIFSSFGFSVIEHGFVLRKTYFSNVHEYINWLDSSGNMMLEFLPEAKRKKVYNEFIKNLSTLQNSFDSYHASSFCIAKLSTQK